jgi:1-acyl-sn-glycerol-3-phosphate acyltransferase
MNLLKNILGRIFALWAAIVFISTMLIVFIPMWIIGLWKEPKRSYIMHSIYRNWMYVFFFFTGMRLRVKGKENFSAGENYIVIYNHNSLIDVPVSVPFMPGANKTIAKVELARIPIFGLFYKRGSVLVDRKNEESRKMSYIKMKEVLNMGLHMCIYPEGTRNKPASRCNDFMTEHSGFHLIQGNPFCQLLFLIAKKFCHENFSFSGPQKLSCII